MLVGMLIDMVVNTVLWKSDNEICLVRAFFLISHYNNVCTPLGLCPDYVTCDQSMGLCYYAYGYLWFCSEFEEILVNFYNFILASKLDCFYLVLNRGFWVRVFFNYQRYKNSKSLMPRPYL